MCTIELVSRWERINKQKPTETNARTGDNDNNEIRRNVHRIVKLTMKIYLERLITV